MSQEIAALNNRIDTINNEMMDILVKSHDSMSGFREADTQRLEQLKAQLDKAINDKLALLAQSKPQPRRLTLLERLALANKD